MQGYPGSPHVFPAEFLLFSTGTGITSKHAIGDFKKGKLHLTLTLTAMISHKKKKEKVIIINFALNLGNHNTQSKLLNACNG